MKEVMSTMTGTVMEVLTTKGEHVDAGQIVIMLESMKMEIPVETLESGKVAEVKVRAGDFVNEGDALLIIA